MMEMERAVVVSKQDHQPYCSKYHSRAAIVGEVRSVHHRTEVKERRRLFNSGPIRLHEEMFHSLQFRVWHRKCEVCSIEEGTKA